MTKSNFFRNVELTKQLTSYLLGLVFLLCSNHLLAQCPQTLGCNDNVNISLDYDCFAVIDPDLILEDEMDGCPYMVNITDLSGNIIESTFLDTSSGNLVYPTIDGSFVGSSWIASVFYTDSLGNNISCWGYITVEDKLPPTITCIEDITVDCAEDLSELFTSSNTTIYCNDNPVDIGMDPGRQTITLDLISDNSRPWEMIQSVVPSIPLAPLSGSGSANMGGVDYDILIDAADGFVLHTEFEGVQTQTGFYQDMMTLTVSNASNLSGGICLQFNSTSFSEFQEFDNCDPNTETIINKDEVTDLQCNSSDLITARRDIEYFTRDNVGLSNGSCEFSIFFERKSLVDLDWPDNVAYDCDDPFIYDTSGMLNLHPDITGWPLLDGDDLIEDENFCRINVTFEDDTFNLCGSNSIKILRHWTALDWCEGLYTQNYQSIKIEDLDGPEVRCPRDSIIFYANGYCTADVFFRPLSETDTTRATIIQECSDITVNVQYLNEEGDYVNATPLGNDVFVINDLPSGIHRIKYIFTDECLNVTECTFLIIVQDAAPPIPVCDQYTAVTLANNGWARAYTETFDDGSYDECGGPLDFEIRRIQSPCKDLPESDRDDTFYGKYVQFCCEEVGDTVDVIMKVTDDGGRANTCLIKVIVQDKTPYTVTCPQKFFDLDCSEYKDTFNIEFPIFSDNCSTGELSFEDSGDFDPNCGLGTIIRDWFVEVDGVVNPLPECQQTFNLTNENILTHDSFQWPQLLRTDATCADYTTNLGDTVRYKGVPVNEADICGLLAYSYNDRIFYNVEGYCLKILRTWTVVDWCIYEPNIDPNRGVWRETQTIKIANSDGPVLENCGQDTVMLIISDTCSTVFSYPAPAAFDQCLAETIHKSDIEYTLRDRLTGLIIDQGFGDLPATLLDVGFYRVSWSVEGLCNNVSTCGFNIDVLDGKAPQPYCKAGITTVLMPPGVGNNDPEIEIWASDFDLNSTDNCDNDLEFSFDPVVFTPNMTFTCDDLGNVTLEVWITDDSGNKDFCITTINIQANNGICPDSSGMMIAGLISTQQFQTIENVEVSLENMQQHEMNYNMTDQAGSFAFSNVLAHDDYMLRAKKDTDHLNGVSTLDLVIIQRHILGLESLDSPYDMIAADVNNNQDVSAVDLIELRKLILGIYDELPNNDSWRFVDKTQTFTDQLNPWPFYEQIELYDLSGNQTDNEFVAVKIGDVNGSVQVVDNQNTILAEANTNNATTSLNYDILAIDNNGEFLVPVYLNDISGFYGLQLSLKLYNSGTRFTGIESGKLSIEDNHFWLSDTQIKLSWSSADLVRLDNEEALFYLTVNSSNNSLRDAFSLVTDLEAEVYEEDYTIKKIQLSGSDKEKGNNSLFQNIPNPFSQSTIIEFELSADMDVTIQIVDTNGSLVRTIKGFYKKGKNAVNVDSRDLNGNGIYYFNLECEAFSATRKMILIE